MINCLKGSVHVLMSVLISTNDEDDDDDHEEVANHVDDHSNVVIREEEEDAKEDESLIVSDTLTLKSSLRKVVSTEAEKREKKKVQWLDVMGKELAEIREFETSEEDDINSHRGKTCVCVIL